MAALVVTEQGARVSVKERRVVVLKEKLRIRSMPLTEVDRVLVFGGVELTTAFMRVALSAGVDVAFFTRDGRFRGRLVGPASRNVFLRVHQVLHLGDVDHRLALARSVVRGKLSNQRALLMRYQRRGGDSHLAACSATIHEVRASIPKAESLDALRGLEGAGAAAYFRGFGRVIRNPAFSFKTRRRRPPPDAVNACLSFGYGVLQGTVTSVVQRIGLDPMVGALHELAYGRPSLVLDLMEEWRPVLVDPVVLRLINRRQLCPQDFGPPADEDYTLAILSGSGTGSAVAAQRQPAVHLQSTGRKIFIREMLRRLREKVYVPGQGQVLPYEAAVAVQAHGVARVLDGKSDKYVPFTVR